MQSRTETTSIYRTAIEIEQLEENFIQVFRNIWKPQDKVDKASSKGVLN